MPKTKMAFWWKPLAALVLASLPSSSPAQQRPAQEEKPASQEQEQKKGTGAVPPGVKLASELPAGAPPKAYRFPKAATRTLPNGLRVFVVSDSSQPAVSVRLVLPGAGSRHDPAGKPGVAEMTANLLTQGTAKRSAQQIAEAIDFVGGTLTANADSDGSYVAVSVVKKDLSLGLDLLSDVVRNAAFQAEELDRRREQLLSNLRIEYADPDYLASAMIQRLVYGAHPYGFPDEGTPDSARAIRRDDLVRFREACYVPNGALLAFAGDISSEAALAAAEKFLGAWPRKELPRVELPPLSPHAAQRFLLVDKPDAVQTQIRVGRLGIPRNSPDYIPLYIANRIFGGGYNSRLNTEVRVRKGLTYGASSRFDSRKEAGSFVASTFTRTEATAETTRLVLRLLETMASGEIRKEELDFARDYLVGVFPIQAETAEQVAERILAVEQYGLPADYNETYQQRILATSLAQVQAMAQKYFRADGLDAILVGKVSQFRETLKKEFPNAQFEEMPFDQVDLLSADLRRKKEAAAPATPEAVERGRALLEAAAQAAGGPAALQVESFEAAGKTQLFTPQGPLPADAKAVVAYPNQVRQDLQLPFGLVRQGYDGKTAWIASPQGVAELPAAEFERNVLLIGGFGVLRQALAGKLEVAFRGEEEVEGSKLIVAEWNSGAGAVKLYFDPESQRLVGTRYRATSPQGSFEALQLWSDFRPVEGIHYPFRIVTYRDGAKFSEQTVQELKLNTKPDAALFAKPKQ